MKITYLKCPKCDNELFFAYEDDEIQDDGSYQSKIFLMCSKCGGAYY